MLLLGQLNYSTVHDHIHSPRPAQLLGVLFHDHMPRRASSTTLTPFTITCPSSCQLNYLVFHDHMPLEASSITHLSSTKSFNDFHHLIPVRHRISTCFHPHASP